ncbi:MAG TPA: ATP-binding protein [Thermodesulfobacteriota bacterium]|nr:ATP-binding protein [Thermodesulfobacteriota bacterium]
MEQQEMKQLAIVSGKGGTGKTTIAAAFASLAKNKVMVDCDVDAADLHLLLKPKVLVQEKYFGRRSPHVDLEKCTQCGLCTEICRFSAIDNGVVNSISCEGCGFCSHVCPENAIIMDNAFSGDWFVSETVYGPFVHARLGIGGENSGKLVTVVRKKAMEVAQERGLKLILIDGPPGIGCPVTASLTGVNLVLAITEPTLSGIHDLERILRLTEHFKVRSMVCINKFDINPENTQQIASYCANNGSGIIGKIPYEPKVVEALVNRKTVMDYPCNNVQEIVLNMWREVEATLNFERTQPTNRGAPLFG